MECKTRGCSRPVYVKKRQLCRTCYAHWHRHGVEPTAPPLDSSQHISETKAAKLLGCTPRKVAKMKERGELPKGKLTMRDIEAQRERWAIVVRSEAERVRKAYDWLSAECEGCGQEFHRKPSRAFGFYDAGKWRAPSRFCSRQCSGQGKRKPRISVTRWKPKPQSSAGPFVASPIDTYLQSEWQAECDVCGDKFQPFRRTGRYCSSHCRYLATKDTSGSPWLRQRTQILEQHGLVCHLCGEAIDPDLPSNHPMDLTIDHVVPRAAGGSDDLDNLRPAHRACNSAKGARTDYALVGDRPII